MKYKLIFSILGIILFVAGAIAGGVIIGKPRPVPTPLDITTALSESNIPQGTTDSSLECISVEKAKTLFDAQCCFWYGVYHPCFANYKYVSDNNKKHPDYQHAITLTDEEQTAERDRLTNAKQEEQVNLYIDKQVREVKGTPVTPVEPTEELG